MRHHDGTIPIYSYERPCQRAGHHGGMDEARVGMMTESQGRQVEEVNEKDELGPDEVAAGEEHHEGKLKQIVEDEMGTASTRSVDLLNIAREEVEDVSKLQNEQDDAGSPGQRCGILERASG